MKTMSSLLFATLLFVSCSHTSTKVETKAMPIDSTVYEYYIKGVIEYQNHLIENDIPFTYVYYRDKDTFFNQKDSTGQTWYDYYLNERDNNEN